MLATAAEENEQKPRLNTLRNNEPALKIFPNPTIDIITQNWNENFSTALYISLYDGKGQQLAEHKVASEQFDLTINMTNLAPGQYYLKFQNEDTTWTKTVVKQ